MKLSFPILLILSFFFPSAFAQKPEPAQAQVKYHFIHIRDTTQRNRPYTENLILLLGRNASAYTSIDAKLQKEHMNNELMEQIKNAPDPNHLNLTISGSRPVSADEYFQFASEHKLFVKQTMLNAYLVEETLPVINWKISSDTLTINSLHCQKAAAHFKGRDYEAWFCPDLPFHSGPWKLNGLPGLIVQASDTKKEVIFEFAGFDDISAQKITISLPDNVISTTQKEFDRLKELRRTDPQAFSKMPITTVQKSPMDSIDPNRISSINIKSVDQTFSKTINNPIELPEKK
jgi:GLPGLI family protein